MGQQSPNMLQRDQMWDRIYLTTNSNLVITKKTYILRQEVFMVEERHISNFHLLSWCHTQSSIVPPIPLFRKELFNFFVGHAQFTFTIPWHFRNTNWAHHHHHSIAHNGRSRPIKMNWIPWHGISLFLLIGTISHVGWTLYKSWMSLSLSLAN